MSYRLVVNLGWLVSTLGVTFSMWVFILTAATKNIYKDFDLVITYELVNMTRNRLRDFLGEQDDLWRSSVSKYKPCRSLVGHPQERVEQLKNELNAILNRYLVSGPRSCEIFVDSDFRVDLICRIRNTKYVDDNLNQMVYEIAETMSRDDPKKITETIHECKNYIDKIIKNNSSSLLIEPDALKNLRSRLYTPLQEVAWVIIETDVETTKTINNYRYQPTSRDNLFIFIISALFSIVTTTVINNLRPVRALKFRILRFRK